MTYLASLLFVLGPFSVGAMTVLLTILSKRLGHAMEMPPYHRLYLVAIIFLFLPIPLVLGLSLGGVWELTQGDPLRNTMMKTLATFIPMTIAITLALMATVKYWHWVWGELRNPRGKGGGRHYRQGQERAVLPRHTRGGVHRCLLPGDLRGRMESRLPRLRLSLPVVYRGGRRRRLLVPLSSAAPKAAGAAG